ncbi:hypothetical protein GA0115233_104939 [Streptomyces sp. DI166]|uniref:hypothetical protein n=1 Tax=unclassified Streptomyces TaxID=2593676 RepID=UPI0007F41EAF|nr:MULTISPECIES: hypothetical protein [unclassified Streptomyces]SBT92704.1 hypothetical protein GA0115233_104939 [Streptomyces sp. DI166]
MADQVGSLRRAYRVADRLLGGEQLPGRTQRFAARHPLVIGLLAGFSAVLFGLLIAEDDGGAATVVGVLLFGVTAGGVFTATSYAERRRQARLKKTR